MEGDLGFCMKSVKKKKRRGGWSLVIIYNIAHLKFFFGENYSFIKNIQVKERQLL